MLIYLKVTANGTQSNNAACTVNSVHTYASLNKWVFNFNLNTSWQSSWRVVSGSLFQSFDVIHTLQQYLSNMAYVEYSTVVISTLPDPWQAASLSDGSIIPLMPSIPTTSYWMAQHLWICILCEHHLSANKRMLWYLW